MKPCISVSCLLLTFAIIGCGVSTPKLPPTEGGTSTVSQEEMQEQMQVALSKSGGQHKGNIPCQRKVAAVDCCAALPDNSAAVSLPDVSKIC